MAERHGPQIVRQLALPLPITGVHVLDGEPRGGHSMRCKRSAAVKCGGERADWGGESAVCGRSGCSRQPGWRNRDGVSRRGCRFGAMSAAPLHDAPHGGDVG